MVGGDRHVLPVLREFQEQFSESTSVNTIANKLYAASYGLSNTHLYLEIPMCVFYLDGFIIFL